MTDSKRTTIAERLLLAAAANPQTRSPRAPSSELTTFTMISLRKTWMSYFEGSAQLFAFSYGMTALGDLRVLLT